MRRCLLACALAMVLPAQKKLGSVTTVQAPKNTAVLQTWFEDLSGDGERDLVLAVRGEKGDFDRVLRVHFAKNGTFAQTPDVEIPVPRSISACAIGDVHSDTGPDVILFGARGVYVWRRGVSDKDRIAKLFACEFLFQYAHPKEVLSWQRGVRDVDGDGRADLLVPEPDGYRVAIQRRSESGAVTFEISELRIPEAAPEKQGDGEAPIRGSKTNGQLSVRMSLGSQATGPTRSLVSISEAIPAPQLRDWDGDGDLDMLVKQGERVFLWIQGSGGKFESEPANSLHFPLTEKQTQLDPRFFASLTDFNGDKRVDAVLVAKDGRSEELRTQIMFFPQKPGPTPLFSEGVPGQLLVLAGFTSAPKLIDIDADGDVDLQINSWRVDVMDSLTTEKQVLPLDIYVYLNNKGKFSKRPDLKHNTVLDGNVLGRSGDNLFIRFLWDVSGDGVKDMLVRDQADRVRLFQLSNRRGKLSIIEEPIWSMRLTEESRVQYFPDGARERGFLVVEDQQVLLVRF